MANKKISELPAAGALTGAELVESVQGGINVKTTAQNIANLGGGGSFSALTDGASITVTGPLHTLTTTQAAITYTLSFTEVFSTWYVTFNQTSATWTFPAGALCNYNGVPSGNNTVAITATSGDKLAVSILNVGSGVYSVQIHNDTQ